MCLKQIGGIWLPDGETHLVGWMTKMNRVVDGKLTYQYHKLEAALKWVKAWRVAVDVGAHCGLWSMHLVKRFEIVHAFEPVMAHRQCWTRNVDIGRQVMCDVEAGESPAELERLFRSTETPVGILYGVALGETSGRVAIHTSAQSSGDSWVDGAGDIPLKRLDEFDLADVDFMKLDCEGYELFALRGGEETLKRCRPCVIVEQKPGRAQKFGLLETGAVDYLRGLGAKLRAEMSGDFILSWD